MNWDRINKRRALVWGAWGLVLVGGLAGLFVWHSVRSYQAALRRFESQVGSARHEDYLRAPVPDDQNAAVAFETVAASIESSAAWSRIREPVAWTAETAAAAREVIVRNQEALEGLEESAKLSGCVWPSGPSVDAASLAQVLEAARLLRLQGFVGVVDADHERVEGAFRVLGDLAECLFAVPHIVGSLVASAIERAQLEVVHAAVSSPDAGEGLLEYFAVELERISAVDRTRWVIAAEGAYALLLLEEQRTEAENDRFGFRSPFLRRMGAELALRWVEFASWSEKPLEDLLSETAPGRGSRLSVAGIVADLVIVNLRYAIIKLRTNRALVDLARVAIQGRLFGRRHGTYVGAFDQRRAGIDVLSEGDGSAVLIDSRLESLLRAHLSSTVESGAHGAERTLDLTVWRLPPPSPGPE